MKFRAACVVAGFFSLVLSLAAQTANNSPASAQVPPPLIQFSNVATDEGGNSLSGVVNITFSLYNNQQGGEPLWTETQNNIQLDPTGHYSVQLGITQPNGVPTTLFTTGEARWLGVQIAEQAQQPRVLLLSVPYALKAGDAATIGGLPPSAFVLAAPGTTAGASATAPFVAAPPVATTFVAAPADAPPATDVTGSGTADFIPLWTTTSNIADSVLFQSGTGSTAKVGINTTAPTSTLDVAGGTTVAGTFTLPTQGTATATKGVISHTLNLVASSFNSSTSAAVNQTFRWQSEPAGNDTSSPSGTLNLLFGEGTATPTETGLHIASNGQLTFATGQTFPGTGTVTSIGTGLGLTGGPITTSGTLTIDTTVVPQLAAANTFTANQTVNANVTATNVTATGTVTGTTVTGAVVNATSSFDLGGTPFAFGSYANRNAFLGFAGNSTMTGLYNTGSGYGALAANTTGGFNTATGFDSLVNSTAGIYNTASGYEALFTNTTGSENTAAGVQALWANTTGNYNTAAGFLALQNNATGYYNTAVGGAALQSNTTGAGNLATGAFALASNTTGGGNTAAGDAALLYNTSGNYNTASGSGALFSNSTGGENNASGVSALYFNTTGSYNTADGYYALSDNTTGSEDTASGSAALSFNTTGNNNTASGFEAVFSNTTGANNTGIGYEALNDGTTGSENTAVGALAGYTNTGTDNTCVGYNCGNSSPRNLNNATAIGANATVSVSDAVVLGSVAGVNGAKTTAKVGIGTTSPTNLLTLGQGFGPSIADGWTTYSSRRWKTNIQPLHNALGMVEQLRGVSYDLKDSGKHEIGVIAEEVGAVVPEVVSYEENGKDARGVDYSRLTALLIEAAKEQQGEIQKEQAQLAKAISQIKQQQSQLRTQSTTMRSLQAEVREARATLRKVKAQVAAAQPALVARK
jgi:trimeric autotransporter adhesin